MIREPKELDFPTDPLLNSLAESGRIVMPLRVLVADDHPMCRAATRLALGVVVPDATVVEAATLAEALDAKGPIDFVILDLRLPDSQGLVTLIALMKARPDASMLVVSGMEGDAIETSVAALGAAGYVPKSASIPQIIEALRQVFIGGRAFRQRSEAAGQSAAVGRVLRLSTLTAAEERVLRAMADGRPNKQIAYELSLSEITIKHHVRAILRKLSVVNRTQAILMYREAS